VRAHVTGKARHPALSARSQERLAPAISDQSAAVQRGDSLHAYDRFSKIEATWSRVDRGDVKTPARSCRLGRTAARTTKT